MKQILLWQYRFFSVLYSSAYPWTFFSTTVMLSSGRRVSSGLCRRAAFALSQRKDEWMNIRLHYWWYVCMRGMPYVSPAPYTSAKQSRSIARSLLPTQSYTIKEDMTATHIIFLQVAKWSISRRCRMHEQLVWWRSSITSTWTIDTAVEAYVMATIIK